jgi:polar amino acid transport system permease protein
VTESITGWFRHLHDRTGINLTVFYDAFDATRFVAGVAITIELAFLCVILSLCIGLAGVVVQGSRSRLVRGVVNAYIQFFRNTPSLIQLYFFYFGLGPLIALPNANGQSVPLISNFAWAAICFSIYAGAFNIEIFRAGVEAVSRSTVEAAEALGYTRLRSYVHVILPLALRYSFSAFSNNMVNLTKLTSVAYAIAVPEILYASSQIWSDSLNVPEMMNIVLVSYVLIVSVFVFAMGRIERALRLPGVGI